VHNWHDTGELAGGCIATPQNLFALVPNQEKTVTLSDVRPVGSPVGLHRVLEPTGEQITLPQSAQRLDTSPELWADEVRIDIETLNLDAASYRQLSGAHQLRGGGTDGAAVKAEVLDIVATRGKMQNPVTGSGGMLIGTVAEVGPRSPLGLEVGDHVATLVSLSLTPLRITDGLTRWDGLGERAPASGHAILFGRSIAAVLPDDLDPELAFDGDGCLRCAGVGGPAGPRIQRQG